VTRTRAAAALVLAVTAALSAGCGVGDAVVGVRDVPAGATPSGAPLTEEAATRIAARVLDAAASGDTAVLSGTAKDLAEAAERTGTGTPGSRPSLSRGEEPDVLALSRGAGWPRTILATTTDPATDVPTLSWLVSPAVTEPFTLAASVPLLAGATVPALPPPADGAPAVAPGDGAGLRLAPQAALEAYAAALDRPKARSTPGVATDDPFATALGTAYTAQQKALGTLATATVDQTAAKDRTLALRLADGGALVVGRLDRKDTVTAKAGARNLGIPQPYARLAGRTTAPRSFTANTLQAVVLVVPAGAGDVTAVAADEQLASATAQ
jgi:hypothetical protein